MMKNIFIIIVFSFVIVCGYAQEENDPLFATRSPLDISFKVSLKKVARSKGDTSYIGHLLFYKNSEGKNNSIKVGLKGRGNFRLQNCFFPPMWMKIEKKDAKETLFQGNKKLKLVLPCDNDNELISREYLCYWLYENISPYAFKTRLVNIDLTELRGKKEKHFKIKGILVEDLDKVAK